MYSFHISDELKAAANLPNVKELVKIEQISIVNA